MSDKVDSYEVVCEGWLIKSPPTTRILRARWRRRFFALRHSGELPGQYFLCYYTDRNCRKVKGQIDLDQCDQVDAGLRFENGKQKYQHMFTIRTPKRIYYLAAESEDDMNRWVDCVCRVCGLKPFISDDIVTADEGDNISQATTGITEISPPVTPSTIITGPYIPISECISGKPITSCTPPPSPGSESVFTDDETIQRKIMLPKKPTVNWETFPRPSDSSADDENPSGTLKSDSAFLLGSYSLGYSNLQSPSYSTGGGGNGSQIVAIPPAVNRELKPGRKYSDSTCSNEPSPTLPVFPPPNIDRKLKPAQHKKTFIEQVQVHAPNDHTHHSLSQSRNRQGKKSREIQYLDLDLDLIDSVPIPSGGLVKKSSENVHSPSTATVYKTVDFLKTEAFNRTRIEIEEERSRLLCMAAESSL